MALLEVRDLGVTFGHGAPAVQGVTFTLDRGQTLALVGESGSGKSVTALSILQLLPYPLATHPSGSIRFDGEELVGRDDGAMRKVRGRRIGMIFQEPMTSLNPLHTVERQISEVLFVHRGLDRGAARARVLELLQLVRIPDPESRLASYPHQLSGGQRQRVMIAMALANEPDILIADEPTTALDVTLQAQILRLLKELQARLGMAILLITHDLTIVRRFAERVAVMTRGQLVEQGPVAQVFDPDPVAAANDGEARAGLMAVHLHHQTRIAVGLFERLTHGGAGVRDEADDRQLGERRLGPEAERQRRVAGERLGRPHQGREARKGQSGIGIGHGAGGEPGLRQKRLCIRPARHREIEQGLRIARSDGLFSHHTPPR